jgi:hypothetical protein
MARPSLLEIAEAISACPGVEATNITVTEIDIETVGMDVTIEGQNLAYHSLVEAIETAGAVVHSIDQIVCGERMIEWVRRER